MQGWALLLKLYAGCGDIIPTQRPFSLFVPRNPAQKETHGRQIPRRVSFWQSGKEGHYGIPSPLLRVEFKFIGLHKVRRLFKNLLPHVLR